MTKSNTKVIFLQINIIHDKNEQIKILCEFSVHNTNESAMHAVQYIFSVYIHNTKVQYIRSICQVFKTAEKY